MSRISQYSPDGAGRVRVVLLGVHDEVRPFLVDGDFTYEAQVQDPAKRLPLQKELEQAKSARAGGAKKRKRGD